MYSTRIHESTISRFVPEVCQAIITTIKEDYLKMPNSVEEWEQVANDFNRLWQFPHCIGALDGRHINFKAPISDGAYYHNYKGSNSIVLLAIADANCIFTYVNIGVNGRISDGGVFFQSNLSLALKNDTLNLPPAKELPNQNIKIPYVLLADDAFPILTNLIKPYSEQNLTYDKKIFNYRLSRARRIIESSFGILANRFRVLLGTMNLCAAKAEVITLTCVVLHNYLVKNNCNKYEYVDIGDDVQELLKIGRQAGNRSSNLAREVRDSFKIFFNSPTGAIPWQEQAVMRFNY